MDPNQHKVERVILVIVASLVGIGTALILSSLKGISLFLATIVATVTPVLYAVFAAFCVKAILAVRSWAYFGHVKQVEDRDILMIAAIWPVAMLTSVPYFLFIGLINRIF